MHWCRISTALRSSRLCQEPPPWRWPRATTSARSRSWSTPWWPAKRETPRPNRRRAPPRQHCSPTHRARFRLLGRRNAGSLRRCAACSVDSAIYARSRACGARWLSASCARGPLETMRASRRTSKRASPLPRTTAKRRDSPLHWRSLVWVTGSRIPVARTWLASATPATRLVGAEVLLESAAPDAPRSLVSLFAFPRDAAGRARLGGARPAARAPRAPARSREAPR